MTHALDSGLGGAQAAPVDWYQVWERRGVAAAGGPADHQALIALNGFDSGAGTLGPREFDALAGAILERLELRRGMSVLEVGCGAGALLWSLRGHGLRLYGVDYAASMVKHARAALPEVEFAVCEATELPFRVDALLCHSVFQYFPDHAYARRVLAAFRRASSASLILDIPDLATRAESEETRARLGSRPTSHTYYPRQFSRAPRPGRTTCKGTPTRRFASTRISTLVTRPRSRERMPGRVRRGGRR